jgi:lactate permease
MILALISVFLIAFFVWEVPINRIAASGVVGLTTVFDVLYIVFAAVLLLYTLKASGALGVIRQSVSLVTADRRIQVIIFVWIFGAFLEGSAGWGSTGAVLGPLLVALGYPALAAAMVIMIFQSMAVSFGAVGTPIRIGLDAGLGQGSIDSVNAVLASGQTWQQYLIELGGKVAILHGIVGVFIPLFIVVMLTGFFGKNRSFKEGFGAWKFALFGGLAISIPYTLTAVFLGPEFPSIFGGLIGVVITVIAASKGWFMPKDQVWDFPEKSKWDQAWFSTLRTTEEQERVFPYSMFRAWLPYIIMAVLLLITRLDFLPFADWLTRLEIGFTNLFGTELGETIAILHSPGTIFIAVSILTYFMHGMHKEAYQQSLKDAFKLIAGAGATLLFAVPMIQIFINSDGGAAGYESMPVVLAQGFTFITGGIWAYAAPLIGGLGAFLAGSNTFSNMMFSYFQFEVAQNIGANPTWVVALQSVGAAAGNMVSVHNVVVACAAVGLIGREGEVIRKVLVPMGYYMLFTGSIGYVLINGFGFNIGTIACIGIVGIIIASIIINRPRPHELTLVNRNKKAQ